MATSNAHPDSFHAAGELKSGNKTVRYFRLNALESSGAKLERLPYSLRILLENLLRHEDGRDRHGRRHHFLARWDAKAEPSREIAYMPARVLMQDFTGVPAVVDLAAMRDAMKHARRRSREDQSAAARRARDRPLRAGGRVRQRPAPTTSTLRSNFSATASATPSSSGDRPPSATSPQCRRAWASATR